MSGQKEKKIKVTLDGVTVEALGVNVSAGPRFNVWHFSAITLSGVSVADGQKHPGLPLHGKMMFRKSTEGAHAFAEWRSEPVERADGKLTAFASLHNIDLARRAIETQIPEEYHQQFRNQGEIEVAPGVDGVGV